MFKILSLHVVFSRKNAAFLFEVGLALWQNCTLDLPLHPHTCAMLFGFPPESIQTLGEVRESARRASSSTCERSSGPQTVTYQDHPLSVSWRQ